MTRTVLVRHADVLVTMDAQRREIVDGGLFIRDGWIEQVGPTETLPDAADEVVELAGHVVLPGLVNTHGALAPDMCADLFAVDVGTVQYAGALHDPVAAVVMCAPQQAAFTMVNGRFVVKEGHLTTVDLGVVVEQHRRIARRLVAGD